MIENQTRFVQFLIQAKKNTYANDGKLSAPSRPSSKDLLFQQGDYFDNVRLDKRAKLDNCGELWQ